MGKYSLSSDILYWILERGYLSQLDGCADASHNDARFSLKIKVLLVSGKQKSANNYKSRDGHSWKINK